MVSLRLVTYGTTATNPLSTIPSRARMSSIRCALRLIKAIDLISDSKKRLKKQLEDLDVPFTNDFDAALGAADHVVDAIFGIAQCPISVLKHRCTSLIRLPSFLNSS